MEQKKSGGSGNSRRRKNYRGGSKSKGKGPNRPQNKDQTGGKSAPGKGRPRRNNNKRRSFGKKKPKLSGFDAALAKYHGLLETYWVARRKYFALFHKADPAQLESLERKFSKAMQEVRDYEDSLTPEYKELFTKKVLGEKVDLTYSKNHHLAPDEYVDNVHNVKIEDPHYLKSQVEHEFSDDEEESVGSIEDYKKLKNIPLE